MRKILFIVSALFLAGTTFSQPADLTKIEQAINTRNSLYKQEVFSVENIPAFRVDVVKITDLEKFTTTSGLKIVHKIASSKGLQPIHTYIDADEVSGLIMSLQYMKTIVKSKTIPSTYTEIKFTSKGGFQVNLYTFLNDKGNLDWNMSVQSDITSEKTYITLSVDNIEKLLKTLEQAKAKL